MSDAFEGKWLITEMGAWTADLVHREGPAYLRVAGREGRLAYADVAGELHAVFGERDGRPFVEWTWEGTGPRLLEVSGRGWARLDGNDRLIAHVFLHKAADSSFEARRARPEEEWAGEEAYDPSRAEE